METSVTCEVRLPEVRGTLLYDSSLHHRRSSPYFFPISGFPDLCAL
jgi:hypothetical protein